MTQFSVLFKSVYKRRTEDYTKKSSYNLRVVSAFDSFPYLFQFVIVDSRVNGCYLITTRMFHLIRTT